MHEVEVHLHLLWRVLRAGGVVDGCGHHFGGLLLKLRGTHRVLGTVFDGLGRSTGENAIEDFVWQLHK